MKSITEAYLRMLQPAATPEVITETTVPEELQHIPESWDHHGKVSDETYAKMKSALKQGSFTHFPLESTASDADPDVIEHLTNHGYEIKDYKAGTATIKKTVGDPSRGIPLRDKHVEEKIGSILERTGATPAIKTSFMNDPSRAASKSSHHVVIATSPLAIAGMTTGTAWRDQSCMNMPSGAYQHKLKDDSENGTHVAFLVPHDDVTAFKHGEPSKPLARIALKPFHGPGGDTIFRPENKTYGANNSAFAKAVSQWSNENYPAQPGHTYTKNRHVYDDTGNADYHALSKEDIEHHVENGTTFERGAMIDHHLIDHAISHAAKHYSYENEPEHAATRSRDHARTLMEMSYIPNLTTSHVAKIHRQIENLSDIGDNPIMNRLAFNHMMQYHGDKASTAMMNKFMSQGDVQPTKSMLMNPKISDEVLDKVDPQDYQFVRRSRLKDKHIDKLVDYVAAGKGGARTVGEMKDHLSSDHINKLIHSDNLDLVYDRILDAKNFNEDHHNAMLLAVNKQTNPYLQNHSINTILKTSKFAKVEDVQHKPGATMYSALMENPHIGPEVHNNLKKEFIDNATGGNPDRKSIRLPSDVFGFGEMYNIPKKMSDHFTKDDYARLAEHNYAASFEDKQHSNKFLDAGFNRAKHIDSQITDTIKNGHAKYPDFDESQDADVRTLKERLHNHLTNYASNIDNHIDNHVRDDDWSGVKDFGEHEKTLNRLSGSDEPTHSIDWLDHYSTPKKRNVESTENEHYNDNFLDLGIRLHDLNRHHTNQYE